jgi:hypothetical protein
MSPKSAATEVEVYGHIRQQLRDLGWVVKNPSLGTGGQVWTQNQCLSHPTIKLALGKNRPENIVKLSERYLWIIEGKAARKDIDKAVDEALHYYSKPINDLNGDIEAIMASGIAGDESAGYIVRTFIRLNGSWQTVTINDQEATGLLRPSDVQFLLGHKTHDIHEFSPPQWLFLQAAERINGILHLGGINKNDRAKTMAALLLAVVEDAPNLDTDLPVMIKDINTRSENILAKHGKPDFAPFVRILPPTNTTNHVKFKAALVKTIQELFNLNIRSAMNSSTDVLGQFYEVFLKYGNGAKEIGIVLTPRHITRFAVEVLGVSNTDIVLDPNCGTGGFLVAAFDYARRNSTTVQLDRFKKHNLFGIEQESYVAALAIVNMIFRGDGNNGITEGDCFTTNLLPISVDGRPSAAYSKTKPEPGTEPVTRVLMNPPFALQGSVDQEYKFVSRALEMMADGGLLFSLVPLDCLFGSHEEKIWRTNDLLAKNTLLAVVTLPHELFYPAALKQVAGIIVRKGFPHPKDQPVFWGRIAADGHLKVKSKRLIASDLLPPREVADDIPKVLPLIRSYVAHPGATAVNEPMFYKTAAIDFSDPLLELMPEAYLDSTPPTEAELEQAVNQMARDTAAFLIRFGKEATAETYE